LPSIIVGYFEQQILEYRQEMEETTSALGNMKAVGKKIADFFRGSGWYSFCSVAI